MKVSDNAWVAAKRRLFEFASATARRAGQARHLGEQLGRNALKPLARLRQPDRLRAAVEQLHPQPLLQGTHAATEGRLRHVAVFCGAGKISDGGKDQEILQPGDVHNKPAVL